MPTIPKVQSLKSDITGDVIFNSIRSEMSASFQERVPEGSINNSKDVFNAMVNYDAKHNEFLNALINRIGMVIITSKMYSNPLKRLKKGMLEYGETIEEIFVNISKAHTFNPKIAEDEVFKREIPDVKAVFHKINRQDFYKQTVTHDELRLAFLSWNGVSDLITRIIEAMYTANETDEFLYTKNIVYNAGIKGKAFPISIPSPTAENAKSIITTIKGISNKLEFMSSNYNSMGVMTHTPKNKQILLVSAEFEALFDVEVLASAFNMNKAEFMGMRIVVDDFGGLQNVVAMLVDEDFFMIFDTLREMGQIYNPQGLYWNYFLQVWQIFSNSPFHNAIIFTTEPTTVTALSIDPVNSYITKSIGGNVNFNVTVTGTGYPPSTVTWGVAPKEGETTGAIINSYGNLIVPPNDTATELTVTATSTFNTAISNSATVTIA